MMLFSPLGPSPTYQGTRDTIQPVVVPETPLEPAASVTDLARFGWMTPDDTHEPDFMLALLVSATERANRLTSYEHAERVIEVRWDMHPAKRQGYGGLAPLGMVYSDWIGLPVYPIRSIAQVRCVSADGEDTVLEPEQVDLESKPARFRLPMSGLRAHGQLASLRVTVTAGPRPHDRTESYRQAVAMLAAYMHDNRNCGADNAMSASGALALLRPYMLRRGL